MAKFKVGDRVVVMSKLCSPLWHRYYGDSTKNAEIVYVLSDGTYHIKLESKLWDDDGLWIAFESDLSPAVPDGWTPASEPPDNVRDVCVITENGERKAWCNYSKSWRIYTDAYHGRDAAPGEVIAWREIEPAAKPAAQVRYVVCAITTEHDTLEEAELHALRAMESLRVNVVIARVVEEVKPGKPEIIRMEE